jgi:hypothetical protein
MNHDGTSVDAKTSIRLDGVREMCHAMVLMRLSVNLFRFFFVSFIRDFSGIRNGKDEYLRADISR